MSDDHNADIEEIRAVIARILCHHPPDDLVGGLIDQVAGPLVIARDAAMARAETAETTLAKILTPSDEDTERIARLLYRQRWYGSQDMSEALLRIYVEWAGHAVAAIRAALDAATEGPRP